LINGDLPILGQLIDKNQELLKQLNVSSPGIEHLVQAARDAGAYGAKLSGGGRGGNVIALASPSQIDSITTALIDAGAVNVISTKLSKES
jgi:mevalonate kinase